MKITAKARVQITVEIQTESWGDDCSIGQLYKQAGESGKRILLNALKSESYGRIVQLGEPRVIGVITEKDSIQ